uniref:Uncharacterized protein n=1 Tax=Triticum urartu TaxID=4572 RepID=A0A8R7V0P3_TRIUA
PFQPPTNIPPPRCHAPPSSLWSPTPRSRSQRRRAQRVACGGRGSGSTGGVGGAGPSGGAWRQQWRRPARRRTACCYPRRGARRPGGTTGGSSGTSCTCRRRCPRMRRSRSPCSTASSCSFSPPCR